MCNGICVNLIPILSLLAFVQLVACLVLLMSLLRLLKSVRNSSINPPHILNFKPSSLLSLCTCIICQIVRGSPYKYDIERTMRYASYGFWFGGPIQIIWYAKILPKIATKKPVRDIALKIGIEFAFATTVFNALYLFIIPVLAMKSLEEAQKNV